jgi:hypothetical protein
VWLILKGFTACPGVVRRLVLATLDEGCWQVCARQIARACFSDASAGAHRRWLYSMSGVLNLSSGTGLIFRKLASRMHAAEHHDCAVRPAHGDHHRGTGTCVFPDLFWERLLSNVGVVLVFAAFGLKFLR